MITVDFETTAILGNPLWQPPRPVGVAVWIDGEEPTYRTDFDHLPAIWSGHEPLLFQNAEFDLAVAAEWLRLPRPHWSRVHDTMYLSFLKDPHAADLGLKPSAERYLGMPPDEQDELRAWVMANIQEATEKNWGAFICHAPVPLVSKYAIGDVVRTRKLFAALHPSAPVAAYDRERRLAPILAESSRRGIRLDVPRLEATIEASTAALEKAGAMVQAHLHSPTPVETPAELRAALEREGLVTEWVKTPTGKNSTAKKNLAVGVQDKELLNLLDYRASLRTCLTMFMLPWLNLAAHDHRLHTQWNQVRGFETGQKRGTRTGRLSSNSPNFQNMPNGFENVRPIAGLPPLPMLRSFLLPEVGHRWLKRDYSSQEVRVLAHYEDGALLYAYRDTPNLDPHTFAQQLIKERTGVEYPRKHVKVAAFTVIYGGGGSRVARTLGIPDQEGYNIKERYLMAFPGVRALQRAVTNTGREGGSITTWGGRQYLVEPAKYINGQHREFAYKMLNYLIQGSAADQTKECLNTWYDEKGAETVFLSTVHDEINISAPIESAAAEMATLKRNMDQPLFDSPSQSEGFMGDNWSECK